MSNKKSVTDAVDKAEHRRRSKKKLKQRLNITSGQRLFIFLSAIAITLISFLYAGLYNDRHDSKAAPGSLTVSINQKTGTPDANPSYTSVFTVQFNEAIDEATFTNPDITLGGTAPGQQIQSITEAGTFNKTTYEVRIQATSAGTIIPTIAQELISAQNIASGTNQASTSTDNSVTYNGDWAPGEFIIRVKTDNPGSNGNNQFTIGVTASPYNYTVDCNNDGTPEATNQTSNYTCNYGVPGQYEISITGLFPSFHAYTAVGQRKVLDVLQWGTNQWKSMGQSFEYQGDVPGVFQISALDAPDLSQVTDMSSMFTGAGVANSFNSNINHWDVSNVTNISGMFHNAKSFNQPLNNWDVSNVIYMHMLFYGAQSFNQSINNWDTGNVINMREMFNNTTFNQSIDNWNVSNVTNMSNMFNYATSFNQSLNDWNVSSVTNMSGMFNYATSFNQSLNNWNVSNVTNMSNMFSGGSGLSTSNYDTTLTAWSQQALNNGITFNGGTSKYCVSTTERQNIITNHSWTISDGGQDCASTRAPQVDTNSATNITDVSATLNGVTSPDAITARGFQYGTTNSYGSTATDSSATITTHGSSGTGDGQFGFAYGITTDSSGNVYVADSERHRIQKFDADGNFLMKFGVSGSGDGQLSAINDVAVDSAGSIYVADTHNHRVQKFNPSGVYVSKWGSSGTGDGQFNALTSIYIDDSDNIFIADTDNNRIQKFDSNGNFLMKFGSNGSGNGQFSQPHGVTVDGSGYIYVSDTYNNRIQKFDSTGAYVTKWGSGGSGNGQFNHPSNAAIDKDGNVYVMDFFNHRVQKFSSNGFYISQFGSGGSGLTEFTFPHDLAFSPNGNLYIQDNLGYRLKRYVGTITANISGLTCGTTYHYRAYATNGYGTGYGQDQTFTTSACAQQPFIMRVKTDNPGASNNNQYTIPANNNYTYNYAVDCNNDGTPEYTNQTGNVTCTYGSAGEYDIAITGTFPHMYQPSSGDQEKIIDVKQWGDIEWQDMTGMFSGASNISVFTATDTPNLSQVTSMDNVFANATNFDTNINNWDVSNITSMHRVFQDADAFNQPLNDWDVSSVVDMFGLFYGTDSFNQPLNNWDVSNVTNMSQLFMETSAFNQPLNNWDVSNVVDMSWMFGWEMAESSVPFNQPLNNWDTSSVVTMENMFTGAQYFNQNINNWDTSVVTNMEGMFAFATSFNQPLNGWNVSNVTDMSFMLWRTSAFNQPLNDWDVSNVTNMSLMFAVNTSFNQPLNNWNVSNVTVMTGMFANTTSFDQSLANWNVSNVASLQGMFSDYILLAKQGFEQQLGKSYAQWTQAEKDNFWWQMSWYIGYPVDESYVPNPSGLSTPNYDATLIAWSAQNLESSVTFDAGTSKYCNSEAQRQSIITNFSWTINDSGESCPQDPFIMRVKTDNPGISNNNQYTIPTNGNYAYNYNVDCNNDGTPEHSNQTGNVTCTYGSAGEYDIAITGTFPHMYQSNGDQEKIIDVKQWGDIAWQDMSQMFRDAKNITTFTATDTPDLSQVTGMVSMFEGASSFNSNIENWDVSNVTDVSNLFTEAGSFNQPLNNWDVSNVTGMQYMFTQSSAFNQPLNSWDVGNVTDMRFMFAQSSAFNQPLNNWNVSNSTNMKGMFAGGTSFNQPLNNWDVSNSTNMEGMFFETDAFNQPLNNWDVSNVTGMQYMFTQSSAFNQPLNSWDVGNVTDMRFMFAQSSAFNQPLNNWNVSNVTRMDGMFMQSSAFNQPLNSWDVGNVTDMGGMFAYTRFNQPLNNWNVGNVTDMISMFFKADTFNQPLNDWNVGSVTSMNGMFAGATDFNQPLNNWDVSSAIEMQGMFSSTTSFDQSLDSWNISNVVSMQGMFGDIVQASITDNEIQLGKSYSQWTQQEKDDFWIMMSSVLGYPVDESYTPNPSGLSTPNYDATLIAWSAQNLESSVIFDAGTSKYCNAEAQRQSIITNKSWTINDAGKDCPATAPSAPLSPSITDVTTTSMKLNWQPPADDGNSPITSYQVQYKASSSSTWINAPTQGPLPTTHVLTNLNPSTSYDFRVAAINSVGTSPYTSPVSGTTLTPSTPSPSPSVTPDPTPSPTTTVTPTPDPEVPTTDTRTNTPVPGTPVYKPKPSVTPAPQRVQDGSGSFTEKLRGYIGALGPSASYAPASLLILLVALAIFYLYQTWREQQVYNHLDKLLRRYRVSKQLRADFVNLSSHYLNTPLQIMRGSLELAQTALPHMAHEIKVIGASLEIMSHDTANLLQANQDSTEASASLVQLDKQDLPHLMRRTGVWLPVVSTVALMLIFEIVILVVGRMGLNPYTVGVFICLTIFAGLMVLFTYRARWRLRSLNKQAQATLSFERNIDSQRVSFMETTTKELNDQIDAMRLPAEKLLATGQVPTFANGYAMLGQVAAKLSQITTVGQVSAETALTPLKPWLESHLPVMTEYVESQGMKFNSKIEPNLAVNLTREALAQIVSSLIGNAVKFSKAGAEIGLTIVAQGDMIHLAVQDTGVGIAKDKLAQLMQPFARGTDVLAYDYEGIGLSLYLDRLIVERVGGELTMRSVVGKGTTVSLLLPRAGK